MDSKIVLTLPFLTSYYRELRFNWIAECASRLKMKVIAISDIHAPIWLKDLEKAVDEEEKDEYLVLVAGDMVNRGNYRYYRKVMDVLDRLGNISIVSIFGNDEYDSVKERIKEENPEITFLEDESIELEIDGKRVGIVGSRGCLELPTTWQRRNIPGIERIYAERFRLLGRMLEDLRGRVDITVLLTHYATTTKTMKGENPRAWRYLGHRGFEKYMERGLIDVSIHGHVHNGSRTAEVGDAKVYNVAFPLWWKLVEIDLESKHVSLKEFLS